MGWGGSTVSGDVFGSVEEVYAKVTEQKFSRFVLDFLLKSVFSSKVRGHTREDVIAEVRANLANGDQLDVTDLVEQGRVNYPNNCYTLDLSNNTEVMEKGMRTLLVKFNSTKRNLTMHYGAIPIKKLH